MKGRVPRGCVATSTPGGSLPRVARKPRGGFTMAIRVRGLMPSFSTSDRPEYPAISSLHAVAVRIGFRLVDYDSVIEIRHRYRHVVHELCDVGQLVVVDVLRFVGHLMVVPVTSGREKLDRNAVARVHVVIAAAVVLLRVAGGIVLVVERERLASGLVDSLDEIAELGRETPRADQ